MQKFAKDNDGYGYFVVFIDIFTRYLYTEILKTLQGVEMVRVVDDIFKEHKRKPIFLFTDRGSEFKNSHMKSFLTQHQVQQIFSSHEMKANYAERVIKTIKLKLYKYMTYKNSHRWIDALLPHS